MMKLHKANDPECPKCGCNDAEPAGRVMMWGRPHRRWRCTHCGHEYSQEEREGAGPACGVRVPYYVLDCPNCAGTNVVTTHTARPVRFHKCRSCGFTFSSIETKAPSPQAR